MRHGWRLSGGLGISQAYGDTDDVPYTERFFLGGYKTLRGFDFRGASPVFLTGSGARIVPVASLDDQPIGRLDVVPGRRPITRQILDAFPAFTRRNGTPF